MKRRRLFCSRGRFEDTTSKTTTASSQATAAFTTVRCLNLILGSNNVFFVCAFALDSIAKSSESDAYRVLWSSSDIPHVVI